MASKDVSKASPSSSADEATSSGSSDGTSSTPNTPPSPTIPLQPPPQPVVQEPPPNGRHSAISPKKSPRSTPKKSRLGVIDEDSDAMSPDIPLRNPLRRLGLNSMKFTLTPIPTLHARRPKDIYDDVEGPRGEKFTDLRNNKKTNVPSRRTCSWKMLVCLGCSVLIVGAALAIGLVVGLKVREKNRQNNQNASTNPTSPGVQAGVPTGNYSVTTYLDNINASCTTNSATWRCYPDQTYSRSVPASLSTLNWMITANGGNYAISSTDKLFSYTFQDVPLTKANNGTDDENWTFTTTFDKYVVPLAPITDDGSSARCFFNATTLTGRLYTRKSKAEALQNATASTGGGNNLFQPWPYALNFYETHNGGAGVPNCYKYINGQLGAQVAISTVQTDAKCSCVYTNFF